MSIFTLYLLFTVFPVLHGLGTFFAVVSVILLIIISIGFLLASDNSINFTFTNKKFYIKLLLLLCLISTVLRLVPDREDIMFILGGYVITNNVNLNTLPSKLGEVANIYLDSYIDELKTKKQHNTK